MDKDQPSGRGWREAPGEGYRVAAFVLNNLRIEFLLSKAKNLPFALIYKQMLRYTQHDRYAFSATR